MRLTKKYVAEVFSLLEKGDLDGYFERYVDPDVKWTITGSNVLSGTYTSRKDFIDKVIVKLKASLSGDIRMIIHQIYVDGNTAIVEMEAVATAKKGHPYNNQYVWIQTFRDGKVITSRVYYDDVLVNRTITY
ncbi:MAG: nuclear transport factor 2 family protein [Gammaproteobacteria bacterium]|nr:nuclear transport factor 2 family protein [Gammaproteobacteria bacterium]